MASTDTKALEQKRKTVYFNLDDPNELYLYEHIKDVKNFSGYVKSMIYANLVEKSGQGQN